MSSYNIQRFQDIFGKNFTYIMGFLRNVEKFPDKPALIDTSHARTWSYKELNEEANLFAYALLKDEVHKSDVVMYQLMNVPEFAFIYLGCQKIGVINSPINFRLSAGEIAYTIDDSKPAVFLFDISLEEHVKYALKLSKHKPRRIISVGQGQCDFAISYDSYIKGQSVDEPMNPPQDAFAEVTRLYTSGTTGRPKGVPLNNINEVLTALDVIINLGLNKNDTLMNLSPLFHRGGLYLGGPNPGLYIGATIALIRRFYPKPALEAIEKYKITFIIGVPTIYKVMIEDQKKYYHNLSSLRGVISMGSPLDRSLCIEMQQIFTPNIFNGYGTSETFWNTLLTPEDLPQMAGTAGKAVFFDDVRVVKVYEDKLAEPDELVDKNNQDVGEVIIKTLKCAYDYYNRPEETEKKLNTDWFYSGDLAIWNEQGYITIVSRKDDMIIEAGENIYPIQIEEVVQEHPKVMYCAVVAVPDEERGQVPVAYVVRKDDSLSVEELKKFISKHPMLPAYKRPRYWRFVDSLPITATGKKQHYKLREQAIDDLKKGLLLR
ncbi:MAG TPA: class I adenylate-forming enzyme family protein [Thermodesulfovibrio thiophilus]|nr:class I adenylate-forming enzyme family protein [Thermodesulfovibrio thiophilus]HQA03368.1 class I adenylate-forming enzyme family protein [Thermodesulfovibrio thiophilus]HQD35778.1 class I adenylate-forming enzyme family protein [Thermodesulfovibrio thiophilus]